MRLKKKLSLNGSTQNKSNVSIFNRDLDDLKQELEAIKLKYNEIQASNDELKKACLEHCDQLAMLKDKVNDQDFLIKKQKEEYNLIENKVDGYKTEKQWLEIEGVQKDLLIEDLKQSLKD